MRFDDVYVAGIAQWLPEAASAAAAVADGRYDAAEHARNDYTSVTVAGQADAPPEMAVRAARQALARANVPAGGVALLLHASVWYQGIDFWNAAPYVHREALPGNRHAPAIDVQQMSNGGLGAVELAASYLAAAPSGAAALVTSSDRFHLPGFDRWRSDVAGIVYGDGAAAMVLARGTGFARLLSLTTIVDTSLEGLYRGGQPFGVMAGERGTPVDNRARRHTHVGGSGYDSVVERTTAGLLDAVDGALADAGTKRTEIARYVFPSVGVTSLRTRYLEPLGLDLAATTWEWGRRTGHVGASDQLLGLHHLVETGAARPGERVMLVGIGAGFSWSCAVVEIDSLPVWDGARRA